MQINANDTASTDDLFEDAGSAGVEARGEFTVATDLQSTLMSAQFAAMDLTGGSSSTHARGGSDGKVMYLDISGVATDSNLLGGTALTGFDLTNVNSAATLNDLIAGVGGIIQITSVASVV